MPVWHKAARQWIADERVVLIGVIQEQHPARCRLFAQWHEIDWPILHDPIGALPIEVVPRFIAIDENGIVRSTRAQARSFERDFLDAKFSAVARGPSPAESPAPPPVARDVDRLASAAGRDNSAAAWRRVGDAAVIWHPQARLNEAIQAYQRARTLEPTDGGTLFRLGVCYLMRHESDDRQQGDFQRAVDFWTRALDTNPNQYIWRRRIQQYGPRLMKPYPFYDWVARARKEITERGDAPVALAVDPYGAELAFPVKQFDAIATEATAPDPKGRIARDLRPFIKTEVTIVPASVAPGQTARVHVTFYPDSHAHWNNESQPLTLWAEGSPHVQVAQLPATAPAGDTAETNETRRVDFEIAVAEDAPQTVSVEVYALYYVCEEIGGTCRYLRQDIPLEISLAHD